jgi:hypothetical protein
LLAASCPRLERRASSKAKSESSAVSGSPSDQRRPWAQRYVTLICWTWVIVSVAVVVIVPVVSR